jgi:carbon monoxide dehydrogenase subunit G
VGLLSRHPAIARCLPGAECLGPTSDGKHSGKVSTKVGPFQASFEGEADVRYDDSGKTVALKGKGVDRKGASRDKMTMDCALVPVANTTEVTVNADVQLSGAIAQFGRSGLIAEVANVLVADFVRNAEQQLALIGDEEVAVGATAHRNAPKPISGGSLLLTVLKSWFRSLFGRAA